MAGSSNMAAQTQDKEDLDDSNYNFLKAVHNNTGLESANRCVEAQESSTESQRNNKTRSTSF